MKPEDFFSENNVPQAQPEQPFEIISSPSQKKQISRTERVDTALGIEKPKGMMSKFLGATGGIALGFTKEIGGTVQGLGKLPMYAAGKVYEAVMGDRTLTDSAMKSGIAPEILESKNAWQTFGKGMGFGAEILMPGFVPELIISKLGYSGLITAAEKGLLTPKLFESAKNFILSKWGKKSVELLSDFVQGGTITAASEVGAGNEPTAGEVIGGGITGGLLGQGTRKVIGKFAPKTEAEMSQNAYEDALGFVKKKNPTITELEQAANERRVRTNAQGKQEIIETPQQKRQAEAVQPLIESGELKLSKEGLPTPESVQIIDQKVTQLDQNLKRLVAMPKYNEPTTPKKLRASLEATKADHKILFASDPAIEKTYDALIDAFMGNVESFNAAGVLKARQTFDKIPAVKNLLEKYKGVMGGNLKTDAVLSIRNGANNHAADLLDVAQSRSVLKQLQPKEAKALIEKAKKFSKADDYVRYVKENKADFPEITSGTRQKVQATQKTKNQYATTLDQDLREVWELSQIMPDPTAGKVFLNTLRTESDLLGSVKSANENYPELYKESNKTFFEKHPWLKPALIGAGSAIGAGTAGTYGIRALTTGE